METVPENAIGIHVRRTDLIVFRPQLAKANIVLCDRMQQAIELDPDATFLLCADNPDSIQMLRKRFGDRVFWRQQKMKDTKKRKQRYTSQADAAMDLYALARTQRIIGTAKSSFSVYAAQLGDIPIDLV